MENISLKGLKLPDVLWVFGHLYPPWVFRSPAGRLHHSRRHEDPNVPLVCHILTHFAWQLTNHSRQSMCVCLCVFTNPPAPPSLFRAPQEDSGALPHLHSSHQLGTGLTGSFSPLCMKQLSSNAQEQAGTQSGFIISCLLSATNVKGTRVWSADTQHVQATLDDYICRCMVGYVVWGHCNMQEQGEEEEVGKTAEMCRIRLPSRCSVGLNCALRWWLIALMWNDCV